MEIQAAFAAALRQLRKAKGMTQEDFQDVASREYISQLERELKNPTLAMIEGIAAKMGMQPLAFLLAVYAQKHPDVPLDQQVASALAEIETTVNQHASAQDIV